MDFLYNPLNKIIISESIENYHLYQKHVLNKQLYHMGVIQNQQLLCLIL